MTENDTNETEPTPVTEEALEQTSGGAMTHGGIRLMRSEDVQKLQDTGNEFRVQIR